MPHLAFVYIYIFMFLGPCSLGRRSLLPWEISAWGFKVRGWFVWEALNMFFILTHIWGIKVQTLSFNAEESSSSEFTLWNYHSSLDTFFSDFLKFFSHLSQFYLLSVFTFDFLQIQQNRCCMVFTHHRILGQLFYLFIFLIRADTERPISYRIISTL